MKTFKIAQAAVKDWATEIKSIVSIDEIRKATSIQPDKSVIYYAETETEISVCAKHGVRCDNPFAS